MAKSESKEIESPKKPPKLLTELAEQAGLDAQRYFNVIIHTVLKKKDKRTGDMILASNEEVYAFLMVCRRYGLDPILKQIHGYVGKDGQIAPIVGVDGWVKIATNHEQYGGHATTLVLQDPETGTLAKLVENHDNGMVDIIFDPPEKPAPIDRMKCLYSVTAFFRKDLDRWVPGEPQWYSECYRDTTPWNQMPRRQMGHKSFSQGARKSFGISGIYDEDEGREVAGEGSTPRPGAVIETKLVIPADAEIEGLDKMPKSGSIIQPGNVLEHEGHEGEKGAAEESASELKKAEERAAAPKQTDKPETPPPPPSDPPPGDDPGEGLLKGDPSYQKKLKQMHAKLKDNQVAKEDWDAHWKPLFGVRSFTKLKVSQWPELMQELEKFCTPEISEPGPTVIEHTDDDFDTVKPLETAKPAAPEHKTEIEHKGKVTTRESFITYVEGLKEVSEELWSEALKEMFPGVNPHEPEWGSVTTEGLAAFADKLDDVLE